MTGAAVLSLGGAGLNLGLPLPLLNGEVPDIDQRVPSTSEGLCWLLADGARISLTVEKLDGGMIRLSLASEGNSRPVAALGLRFSGIAGVARYFRNGYQSWDGSYFVDPGTPAGKGPPAKAPTLGFAVTALLPAAGDALILGFARHDRFQNRFRFGGTADAFSFDVETLLDETGACAAEDLFLFTAPDAEAGLTRWSTLVADHSPLPPRIPSTRITGWCSWYNHYAMIDAPRILGELASCAAFRDAHNVPLDVFLIDDGFTPEMGDWLDVRPQFPNGMEPIIREIAQKQFVPGLWIAPFMVGNRSQLFRDHPDWVVQAVTGGPYVQARFYGEFRWHKRSEEYYILDVTHPEAADYIASVFRQWRAWGVGYFKTDFMFFGAEHGPETVRWHRPGQSRIAIWRRMAEIIRNAIGDALWLGCGCPLWASVGFVDAVRIGRDIGVDWEGEYSAESLLRDLAARNHGNGVLWQSDPDCILLRRDFHNLSEVQIQSLAQFAAASGGLLMTSDTLTDLPEERAALFADLLRAPTMGCDFPMLGRDPPGCICFRIAGSLYAFNTTDAPLLRDGMQIAPFAIQRLS